MRGWWPWNPKAMRVSRRILVLVDSTSAFDKPVIEGRVDGSAVGGDLAVQIDERGEL